MVPYGVLLVLWHNCFALFDGLTVRVKLEVKISYLCFLCVVVKYCQ